MFSNEDIENVIRQNAEKQACNLEKYSKTCGPAVLARVKGISRIDAAIILSDLKEPTGDWSYTDVNTLGRAIGRDVRTSLEKINVELSDRFPTMSKWLESNRTRIAILRVNHHFAYVGFSYVLETNGFDDLRGRVSHVIYLD